MSGVDYNIIIDTPENLELESEIAGFGSRFFASFIDHLFFSLVMLCTLFLFSSSLRDSTREDKQILLAIFAVVQLFLLILFHLLFELLWNGQTPGKRIIGIRVVQNNALPVTSTGVFIRNLVRLFDFLPLAYGIGLMVMFASKQSQRLGDMAARTIVIYERHQLTLRSIQRESAIRYQYVLRNEALPEYVNPEYIGKLDEKDRQTIRGYLQRRDSIKNPVPVARTLAGNYSRKMGIVYPASTPPDRFLEFIALALNPEDNEPRQPY